MIDENEDFEDFLKYDIKDDWKYDEEEEEFDIDGDE